MIQKKEFAARLADVPPLPDTIYRGITAKIRKRAMILRTVYATAAAIVLTLGTATFFIFDTSRNSAVSQELVSELQTIHDYLNGNDLDKELQVYAVFYNED
ncbi:MAG: hypothetical protein JW768_13555 [Chitinispirillaceae bacterium]|nr:hypothetical protein [Chitinispirillaceae bacterium]